jgi:hypothetical protein
VLGPCHGGGKVSIGREFKGAVAPAEEGVREEEQAWGRRATTRGGRGSRRWSGSGGTVATVRGTAPAAVRSRAGEAGEQRGLRGRRRGKVRGAHLEN